MVPGLELVIIRNPALGHVVMTRLAGSFVIRSGPLLLESKTPRLQVPHHHIPPVLVGVAHLGDGDEVSAALDVLLWLSYCEHIVAIDDGLLNLAWGIPGLYAIPDSGLQIILGRIID